MEWGILVERRKAGKGRRREGGREGRKRREGEMEGKRSESLKFILYPR